jgi:hypothetical protein
MMNDLYYLQTSTLAWKYCSSCLSFYVYIILTFIFIVVSECMCMLLELIFLSNVSVNVKCVSFQMHV